MDLLTTRYFPDSHFSDEHRALFAFASYNAGPSNIAKMRAEAAARGLDPAHPPNRHQSNWAPVLVRRLAVPTYRQPLGFEVCAADFDVNSKLTRTQSPIGWSFFQPYVEEIFLISSSEKIQFCCDHG
ncbi:hypothetical protein KB879_12235 [Cupriavidus sp. KK10]|uniref:hypothetical protein n=1 Tax=Cupriavidus sp. KK10 TaxID=1478019 RepID=UPI001BAA78E9|nr:hypothetical protein [Cupriavidus sp. KK10]QUN30608.1 hypothetical protein KB879_12235 [Cupriavidus sp. KK10]